MNAPKLTPWFPGHIKPVRPGVYEVDMRVCCEFALWDGGRWGWAHSTIKQANRFRATDRACQHKKWRGLAEQPK